MSTTTPTASEPVLKNLDRLIPDLEALYKDVHSHPELSMQETRTAALAADRAPRRLDLRVVERALHEVKVTARPPAKNVDGVVRVGRVEP